MPKGSEEGIINGMYCFKDASEELIKSSKGKPVHLLASGSIMQQAILAQESLESEGIPTYIWSVTSYNLLHREYKRANKNFEQSYLEKILEGHSGHFISVSDWVSLLPDSLTHLFPGGLSCLSTDGYGLSETRETLRDHFGVSAKSIIKKAKELLAQ